MRHGNQLLTEEKIVQKIRWEVRTGVMSKGRFPRSKENEDLFNKWDLFQSILETESKQGLLVKLVSLLQLSRVGVLVQLSGLAEQSFEAGQLLFSVVF